MNRLPFSLSRESTITAHRRPEDRRKINTDHLNTKRNDDEKRGDEGVERNVEEENEGKENENGRHVHKIFELLTRRCQQFVDIPFSFLFLFKVSV